MRKIFGLLGSVCLAAPVWAQDVPPVSAAQQRNLGAAAQDEDSDENYIVVTAQRREERLTDVPLSITTLGGEELAKSGITSTLNLGQVTPALNFATQGVFSQPTIRGIGSTGQGIGDNPNVATYVDGVYQPAQYGGVLDLNNIERIEVLKGPQGTLFGRNATGGAIQIITRDPEKEFGGNITVKYARFNERVANVYVTGGSGNFAMDVAGYYLKDDGYIRDIARDDMVGSRENKTVRSKMKLDVSDSVNFTVIGTFSDREDNTVISGYNLDGNSATGVANPGQPLAVRPNTTSQSFLPVNSVRQRGWTLTAHR
jgi:iron complex outermembrane receptor protein